MIKRKKTSTTFSLFAFQDIITSVCGIIVLVTLLLTLELSTRVVTSKLNASSKMDSYGELKAALEEAENHLKEIKEKLQSEETALDEVPLERRKVTVEELEQEITDKQNKIAKLKRDNESLVRRYSEMRDELNEKQKRDEETKIRIDNLRNQITRLETVLESKRRETEQNEKPTTIVYSSSDSLRKPYLVEISGSEIKATLISSEENDSVVFRGSGYDDDFIKWAITIDPSKYYFVFVIRPSGIEISGMIRYILTEKGPFRLGIDLIAEDQIVEVE